MELKNRAFGSQKQGPEVVEDDDSPPAGVHVVARGFEGTHLASLRHIEDDAHLVGCLRVLLAKTERKGLGEAVACHLGGILEKLDQSPPLSLKAVHLLLDLLVTVETPLLHPQVTRIVLSSLTRLYRDGGPLCFRVTHFLLPRLVSAFSEADMPAFLEMMDVLTDRVEQGRHVEVWQWNCPHMALRQPRKREGQDFVSSWWDPCLWYLLWLLKEGKVCVNHPRILHHLRLSLERSVGTGDALGPIDGVFRMIQGQEQEWQEAAEYLLDGKMVDCLLSEERHFCKTGATHTHLNAIGIIRFLYEKLRLPSAKGCVFTPTLLRILEQWLAQTSDLMDQQVQQLVWCLSTMPVTVKMNVGSLDMEGLLCRPEGLDILQSLICRDQSLLSSCRRDQLTVLVRVLLQRLGTSPHELNTILLLILVLRQVQAKTDTHISSADGEASPLNASMWLRTCQALTPTKRDMWVAHCQLLVLSVVVEHAPQYVRGHPVLKQLKTVVKRDRDLSEALPIPLLGMSSVGVELARRVVGMELRRDTSAKALEKIKFQLLSSEGVRRDKWHCLRRLLGCV